MLKQGLPLTREHWMMLNYFGGEVPEPWTLRHEMAVPPPFRDLIQVGREDDEAYQDQGRAYGAPVVASRCCVDEGIGSAGVSPSRRPV